MQLPSEVIFEEEIVLSPLDRAIALDSYFNGQAPLSWGFDTVNLVGGVNVTGQKPVKKDKSYFYLFAGIIAAVLLATFFYYRFKK
jgi:hypothetical protein